MEKFIKMEILLGLEEVSPISPSLSIFINIEKRIMQIKRDLRYHQYISLFGYGLIKYYVSSLTLDKIVDILLKRDYIKYDEIESLAFTLVALQHSACSICGKQMLSAIDLTRQIINRSRETINFIMKHPETLEDKIICCDCYKKLHICREVF